MFKKPNHDPKTGSFSAFLRMPWLALGVYGLATIIQTEHLDSPGLGRLEKADCFLTHLIPKPNMMLVFIPLLFYNYTGHH